MDRLQICYLMMTGTRLLHAPVVSEKGSFLGFVHMRLTSIEIEDGGNDPRHNFWIKGVVVQPSCSQARAHDLKPFTKLEVYYNSNTPNADLHWRVSK